MKANDTQRVYFKGFTILEVLIVIPIASILSILLASTIFDQYGQLLQNSARARLRMEGEIMLLSLEDELLFTTGYGITKSNDLTDANAPAGGWTHNTTPNETLIIYETALTADRRDANRNFVYRREGNCNTSYNIALNNLIYFTTKNADDPYHSLFRRTLTPQYATCGVNYKTQTCPTSAVTAPCAGTDALLSEKVVSFQIDYFDQNNIATSDPAAAELIKLHLILGEKIYGESIEVETTISMKKVN